MSDSLGKAVLELAADGTGLTGDLKTAEDKVRASADVMQSAFATIGIGFSLKAVIDATIEAEKESMLLAAAVKATGMAAGFSTEQLKAQALALQSATGVGDEAIVRMQRSLMQFRNINGEVFRASTQVVLDFAAATGRDGADAAKTLGMAINDPVAGLSRLKQAGVAVTAQMKQQVDSFVASGDLVGAQTFLIGELQKSYGGAAVAARDGLGGALNALKEKFGDLFLEQEGAGKQLRVFIELVTQSLPTIAAVFSTVFSAVKSQIEGVVTNLFYLGQGLNNLIHGEISAAMSSFGEIVNPITLMATSVAEGSLAWDAATASIKATDQAVTDMAASAPLNAGIVNQSSLEMQQQFIAASQAKMAQSAKEFDDLAKLGEKNTKEIADRNKRIAADQKAANASRISDMSATFGTIASLSQSHNSTMAAIGKAAGIAQATIDTYIGAGRALALGPIIGPPLAALVIAAGMANVARIAGVRGLETGGRMHAGETALVGEGGPELFTAPRSGTIIPNGEFGGGGGGVTVNNVINVDGIDFSDPASADRILMGIADAAKRGTESAIPAANAFRELGDQYQGRAA